MMNFLKGAFKDENKYQIEQREFVEDAQRFHGSKSYSFFEAYLLERERKLVFILENIVSEEFSQDDFLEFLAKEKGNQLKM